jgi:hypothetical protein
VLRDLACCHVAFLEEKRFLGLLVSVRDAVDFPRRVLMPLPRVLLEPRFLGNLARESSLQLN